MTREESIPPIPPDPECPGCGKAVQLNLVHVKALGNYWHPYHFKCTDCACVLNNGEFYHDSQSPFCRSCYFRRFMDRCGGCREFIEEGPMIIVSEKEFYHPECLTCHSCGSVIQSNSFYQKGQKFICSECYENQHLSSKKVSCVRCRNEIVGQYLETPDGQTFHRSCFYCENCHQLIHREYALDRNGNPRCPVACTYTPPPYSPPTPPPISITLVDDPQDTMKGNEKMMHPNLVCQEPVPPFSLGSPVSPVKRHSIQLHYPDHQTGILETVFFHETSWSEETGFLFAPQR